jgi:hypothetical protein
MAVKVSEAPLAAAESVSQVLEKIRAFVASAKLASKDGITISEFAELSVSLLKTAMAAVESIPIDGPSKKVWVLEAIGLLFDAVADKAIPFPVYPLWVLVRPAVRSLVLAIAGGAVEAILPLVRSKSA